MHNILCLNKISPLGTDRLGENYTYAAEIENPEGILVRSAAMHDMELPQKLLTFSGEFPHPTGQNPGRSKRE